MTKPTTTFPMFLCGFAPALALLAVVLLPSAARAQTCGDVTGDDKITASDAQRVLKAAVGQDVSLTCTDQCAALETRVAALEALLANVTIDGDNLVLTGMNFQVVSGSGTTNGTINGTGNIIIGYDETNSNKDSRAGSHNLVVGRYHSYPSYGGVLAGENNEAKGDAASVLGGSGNLASGDLSVVLAGEDNVASGADAAVVGGQNNEARQTSSVVLAGENNLANGRSCVIASGTLNLCSGAVSLVDGGQQNICSGAGSVIGGGSSRTLGSNLGWLAGSLGPAF